MAYTWYNLADMQWRRQQAGAARTALRQVRIFAECLGLLTLQNRIERQPAAGSMTDHNSFCDWGHCRRPFRETEVDHDPYRTAQPIPGVANSCS